MNIYSITEFSNSCANAEFFDRVDNDSKESNLQEIISQADDLREDFLDVIRAVCFVLQEARVIHGSSQNSEYMMLELAINQLSQKLGGLFDIAENFNELKSEAEGKLSKLHYKVA